MNKGIDAARTSALNVANLIADALHNPKLAVAIAQEPQRVATARGMERASVLTSDKILKKGQQTITLSYWV